MCRCPGNQLTTKAILVVLQLFLIGVAPQLLPAQAQFFVVPIEVTVQDGRSARRGMIDARLEASGALDSFATAPLRSLLEGMLTEPTVAALKGSDWTTPAMLEEMGLVPSYDTASLAARIHVPPLAQPTQRLSLRGERSLPNDMRVPTALLSISLPYYLSVQATDADPESYAEFSPETRYGINLLPAVGLGRTLLSAKLDYGIVAEELELENWEAALSRDFGGTTRVSAGTTRIDTFGFQTSQPVMGLGIERREGIGGTQVLQDRYQSRFEVNTDSIADVYVNNRLIRSSRLAPGSYELSDFPLLPGLNEVRIEITDVYGDSRVIDGRVAHAPGLLPRGLSEFGIAAGMLGDEFDTPLARGYLRRGLLDSLSGDIYAEGTEDAQLMGLNLLTVSFLGTVGLGGAATLLPDEGIAELEYAARGSYQFRLPSSQWYPSLGLSALFRSDGFFAPGAAPDSRPTSVAPWVLNASISQPLPLGAVLLFGGRYTVAQSGRDDSVGIYAFLSAQLSRQVSMRAGASYDYDGREDRIAARITVVARTGSGRGTYRGTYHATDQEVDLGATQSFRGDQASGSVGLSVDRLNPQEATVQSLAATARVNNYRAELSTAARMRPGEEVLSNNPQTLDLRARFGSGFYFADGLFGIGRPSTGSFALVNKQRDLPSGPVLVNPSSRGAEARTGLLGSAVLYSIPDYYEKQVRVELPELPIDYALESSAFIIETGHRTGTAIRIRGDRLLYGSGTLVSEAGEAIRLRVFRVSNAEGETVFTGFTDEQGGFVLFDLSPGEYRIRLTDAAAGARFQLSADLEPPFELGELRYLAADEE